MKRWVLILVLVAGTVGISGLALFIAASRSQVEPAWPWFRRPENVDGRFLTKSYLNFMAADIVAYSKICDAAEWQAICKLQSPREIWAILGKRIRVFHKEDEDFVDAWGDPYFFEVSRTGAATLIRIGSKGNGPPLNGTRMFIDLEFDVSQKLIQQKVSWDFAPSQH
jgi:hypothetical protein